MNYGKTGNGYFSNPLVRVSLHRLYRLHGTLAFISGLGETRNPWEGLASTDYTDYMIPSHLYRASAKHGSPGKGQPPQLTQIT